MMRGFDGKLFFVGSWWSKFYFELPPVWRSTGAGTGDFDFLVKFPTRTENLREGLAERTREGPLGGTLTALIAGLAFDGKLSFVGSWWSKFISSCPLYGGVLGLVQGISTSCKISDQDREPARRFR